MVTEADAEKIIERAWKLASNGMFSGGQTVEVFGSDELARQFERDFEGNEVHLAIAHNVMTQGDSRAHTPRWSIEAFCWLTIFYVMLKENPEITISMYAAAQDVFPELTFEQQRELIQGLIKREPSSWEKVLGRAKEPAEERILQSLSRWEVPDTTGLFLGPFSQIWDLESNRRPLAKPE